MTEQKKSKKAGKRLQKCAAYRARSQREKNKAQRLWKHVRHYPNDEVGWKALGNVYLHLPPEKRAAYKAALEEK